MKKISSRNKQPQSSSSGDFWNSPSKSNNFSSDPFAFNNTAQDKKGKKQKTKKPKKPKKPVNKKKLLGVGIPLFLVTASAASYFLYFTPPVKEIPTESTGAYHLSNYISCLNAFDVKCLEGEFEKSYVAKENAYLNGNKSREKFVKAVANRVGYSIPNKRKLDWFGRPATDPFSRQPIIGPAPLNFDSEVRFSYIDYSQIPVDSTKLLKLAQKHELTPQDVQYSDKATDIFAEYVADYLEENKSKPPLKTIDRRPFLDCTGEGLDSVCELSAKEDEYWDDMLFSSNIFQDFQDKFAETLGETLQVPLKPPPPPPPGTPPPPPVDPNNPDAPPPPPPVPATDPGDQTPEEKRAASRKFEDKYYLLDNWIGAHTLLTGNLSEDKTDTSNLPRVGDGTFEKPAGIGTPVVTHQYGLEGAKIPIKVTLTKFVTDKEAFKIMESKSQQNKGFTLSSDIKYAYYTFKVQNLSDVPQTLYLNDSLSDPQKNLTVRTGNVFGLNNVAHEVPPGGTAVLESWTSSTNLPNLYLIWGANFNRDDDPVWFRVLSGSQQDKESNEDGK